METQSNHAEVKGEGKPMVSLKGLDGDSPSTVQNPIESNKGSAAQTNLISENLDSMPSHQTATTQAMAQPHPKKKGGFAITSVKDNVDGDESADDLDESHTSYSDMSYSRTTDIDHDQESSASEDTLNITLQDGLQQLTSGSTTAPHPAGGVGAKGTTSIQAQSSLDSETADSKLPTQAGADSKESNKKTENVLSQAVAISAPKEGASAEKPSLPHAAGAGHSSIAKPGTAVSVHNGDNSNNKLPPASSSTPLPKGGASRVYKVVKRENLFPVRRERSRWIFYDYSDVHSPNFAFVVHSSSDTKLNQHESSQPHATSSTATTLPSSLSATSVPSNASSYSLQHSDSNSSVYRDSHATVSIPFMVQQSASTSSVNHDMDPRKLHWQAKQPVSEQLDETSKSKLHDEKVEATDRDVIKNVIQSYVDQNASEDESSSTPSVRIDNKIEAAMDLVKKHLMLAVRDEVDELKEKIIELQDDNFKIKKENDFLKGVLTSEQMATVQQYFSKQGNMAVYNIPVQLDKGMPSQATQLQSHQPQIGQTPLPNSNQLQANYGGTQQSATMNTPPASIQIQPIHMNQNLVKSQQNIPLMQQQQMGAATSGQAIHAQISTMAPVTPQASFPPAVYQPVPVQGQPSTPLSVQQMQALRQQGFQATQPTQKAPGQAAYQGQSQSTLPAGSFVAQTPFQQSNVVRPQQPSLVIPRPQPQQQQAAQQQQQPTTPSISSITSPTNSAPGLAQQQQQQQPYPVLHAGPTAGHVTNTSAQSHPTGTHVPPPVANQKASEPRGSLS